LRTLVSLSLVLIFTQTAFAKLSAEDRKLARKAEAHYEFSEYDEALPIFLKLLQRNPENAKFCYHAGICYYYSSTARPLSVPYFERALKLQGIEKSADLYLHAGLAYLSVNRFSDANSCFHLFRSKADATYDPTVADRFIKYCENGMKAWEHPARARIRNLGKNVNSPYPDYAPVLTQDESRLLFTSKRPGTTGGRKDENGYYYEDIYQSKNLNSRKWSESGKYDSAYAAPKFGPFRFFFARAENVSEINTNDHDGSIAISPSGNDLFIFRYGDIWKAGWNGSRWEKPKKLHQEVDARSSVEPSMCFSPDETTLYFVSDRKGGFGGKDLWFARKNGDGTWSAPENMGPRINSALNEDAPFITKDGKFLYFSSEGHNSMGGFDVFKSEVAKDGSWTSPQNLGAPINNGGDDIFYTPDATGNFAYYSSLNRYDEGDLDLYSVMYYPEVSQVAKLRLAKDILPAGTKLELSMKNAATGEVMNYTLMPGDSIIYPYAAQGKSVITLKADGYQSFSDTILFSPGMYDYSLQTISLRERSENNLALQLNSYSFDIDYAVDADTVLDLLADRKKAREIYLAELTGIEQVYTSWKKTTEDISLARNGSINNTVNAFTPAVADANGVTTLDGQPVLFEFNESFIRDDMKKQLDDVADLLKKDRTVKLQIDGHADSKGTSEYNLALSKQRANAVRNYFIISGIAPERLIVVAEGDKVPVAPNTRENGEDNPQGRIQNRRVELSLIRNP
jgi:outer membrane protein OmpA-like peptidoglycan-associated protein/tetratricopeptide (TPR) repeat protein